MFNELHPDSHSPFLKSESQQHKALPRENFRETVLTHLEGIHSDDLAKELQSFFTGLAEALPPTLPAEFIVFLGSNFSLYRLQVTFYVTFSTDNKLSSHDENLLAAISKSFATNIAAFSPQGLTLKAEFIVTQNLSEADREELVKTIIESKRQLPLCGYQPSTGFD